MTTYEKLVDGATKIKLAPPKPKYVEPILMAVSEGERSDSFRTIMRALNKRLQDSAWTIVYKSLILIHIMIREGDENVCIKYLSNHLSILDVKIGKSGKFIANGGDLNQVYTYSQYLAIRAKEYGNTGHDFIRETKKPYGSWNSNDKSSILRELSIDKGLLRETESIQRQIDSLLRCRFRESEVNNDLVVLSFRMLTTDLISLYQCLNEGVLNILEHFFDLSKNDAERAFEIYEHFTKQTKKVIEFLRVAKHLESITKLRVPTIKHAQTSLTDSLKEYLDDPDFEINRRQYLAEKEFAKSGTKNDQKNDQVQPKQQIQQTFQQSENEKVQQQQFFQAQVQAQAQAQAQAEAQAQAQAQAQIQAQQEQLLQEQLLQQQALQKAHLEAQAQLQAQTQFLQAQATANATANANANIGFTQNTTGFNPFVNMNSFSIQPSQIPPPQAQSQAQAQLELINAMQQQQQMNLQTPVQSNSGTFIMTPLQQPRVLSNNFTGNGFGNNIVNNNSNIITSPMTLNSPTRTNSTMSNNKNPFSNSRFSTNSITTAFTTQDEQEHLKKLQMESTNTSSLKAMTTGTNPFRLETNITSNNNNNNFTINEIKSQPTAGGLERLPTIPVFPETKRDVYQQQLQMQAGNQLQQGILEQKIAVNPFTQQATGYIQQAQQQPQQQPQPQQQIQQGFNFIGQPVGNIPNVYLQQQQQLQQQQLHQQLQQQQQQQQQLQQPMFSSVYNGPNLLG